MKIGDNFFERVFINSETRERKVILWTIAAIDEEEAIKGHAKYEAMTEEEINKIEWIG